MTHNGGTAGWPGDVSNAIPLDFEPWIVSQSLILFRFYLLIFWLELITCVFVLLSFFSCVHCEWNCCQQNKFLRVKLSADCARDNPCNEISSGLRGCVGWHCDWRDNLAARVKQLEQRESSVPGRQDNISSRTPNHPPITSNRVGQTSLRASFVYRSCFCFDHRFCFFNFVHACATTFLSTASPRPASECGRDCHAMRDRARATTIGIKWHSARCLATLR